MGRRTVEQERAERALDCIRRKVCPNEGWRSAYASLVRQAPADVQVNGLGQTLAFWLASGRRASKESKAADALYKHVSAWIKGRIRWQRRKDDVMEMLTAADTGEYRLATSEAMAFLVWLKRFAEAEIKSGEGQ